MPIRSPMAKRVASGPTASTTPTISWPGTTPWRRGSRSPSARCRSVRQTPQTLTRTRTSRPTGVGPGPLDQAHRPVRRRSGPVHHPGTHRGHAPRLPRRPTRDTRRMPGDETASVTEHVSFCRICNAMCGIVVTVAHASEGQRVERVRGDADHALSRGYTCPKGRALGALHHDPRRLDHPARRPRRRAARRRMARRARRPGHPPAGRPRRARPRVDRHVPGQRLGLRHRRAPRRRAVPRTCSARPRSTPPPRSTRRASRWWPSWSAAGRASPRCGTTRRSRLLILFGCNPVVSHGHSNAMPDPVERLREHRAAGGQVWVVDPRRTETAARADRHLQLRPGTDWLVLGWLVRRLLDDPDRRADAARRATGVAELAAALGPITDELVTSRTGLALDDLDALLAAVLSAGPGERAHRHRHVDGRHRQHHRAPAVGVARRHRLLRPAGRHVVQPRLPLTARHPRLEAVGRDRPSRGRPAAPSSRADSASGRAPDW